MNRENFEQKIGMKLTDAQWDLITALNYRGIDDDQIIKLTVAVIKQAQDLAEEIGTSLAWRKTDTSDTLRQQARKSEML